MNEDEIRTLTELAVSKEFKPSGHCWAIGFYLTAPSLLDYHAYQNYFLTPMIAELKRICGRDVVQGHEVKVEPQGDGTIRVQVCIYTEQSRDIDGPVVDPDAGTGYQRPGIQ